MKNGNATFFGWFRLCVFLLAILSPVARADFTMTYNLADLHYGYVTDGPYTNSGTLVWSVVNHRMTATSVGNPVPHFTFRFSNGATETLNTNYGMQTVFGSHVAGPVTTEIRYYYWPYDNPNYNGPANGTYQLHAGPSFYWDGTTATNQPPGHTVTISLAVANNLQRAQTISCTGVAAQMIPADSSQTLTFTVIGATGSVVGLGSSPDSLVFESNYDPIVIGAMDSAVQRSAHVGQPKLSKHIHAVFINYATTTVVVRPLMDGNMIGQVDALGSDGVNPKTTSYDWELSLSPDTTLYFNLEGNHTRDIQVQQALDMTLYVVTIDESNAHGSVSTTVNPSDGTTTIVATDSTTGTTTIEHSTPQTPTNTSTDPGTVFGGGNTPNPTNGSTYGNTTSQAGSAAAQESAASLAAIERNTRNTADATKATNDTLNGLSSDGQVGKTNLLNTISSLSSNAPQAAANYASSAASQGQTNASGAYSSFGTTPGVPSDPGDAGDPTVQLNIGPGKMIAMHLNPFSTASDAPLGGAMGSAAAFVKRLIAWGLVAAFFIWCMGRIREMTSKPFAVAPFGDSIVSSINSVKLWGWGGGIGYAAKLVIYGLLLTIVLTMPLVVMASVTAGLPWSSLVSTWSAGPGTPSGVVGSAVAMANQVVPWAMLMAVPVYYFAVEFILFPSQFFWMMFIKFLPV